MTEIMKNIIKLAIEKPLSERDAMHAFTEIMSGRALEGQIADLLIALKSRGETVTEIKAAAKIMTQNHTFQPAGLGPEAPPHTQWRT